MPSLFALFANNLLPVFLAAGSGYVLAHFATVDPRSLSRVAFYIFSPCLVFILLTENQLGNGAIITMIGFAMTQMALTALLAYFGARVLRFNRTMTVAVVLGGLLPNAGNFGMSVNLFAFGEAGLAQASLYFIASAIMAHTFGVYIASLGKSNWRTALFGLAKIPTVYAVILAFVFIRFGLALPTPVHRAASVLGDAAVPSMLVLLGMQLKRADWKGKIRELILANGVRLLGSPLIAVLLIVPFGLTGLARSAGILEAAMPAAVMTTVLTTEFDVEPAFMTAVVFTTTMLSPLTLTPLLAILAA